jgi:hypothetical protein
VGRWAARYDSGLSANKHNRPARKRPAPHRIAHEPIACSRSRCGHSISSWNLFLFSPVNPHLQLDSRQPTFRGNHTGYDTQNRLTNLAVNNSSGPIASYLYALDNAGHRTSVTGNGVRYLFFTGRKV